MFSGLVPHVLRLRRVLCPCLTRMMGYPSWMNGPKCQLMVLSVSKTETPSLLHNTPNVRRPAF